MDFDDTLEASRVMPGPLGAAAFVAIRMAEANGVEGTELDTLKSQLSTWTEGVDEETRALLAYVLDQRVSEAHGRGAYSGLVTLVRRLTIIEAHILHDALVQSGVETRIRREHGSVADVLHPKAGVELWVRPHAIAQARSIVESLRSTTEGVRNCSACEEESPAHFGRCWNCGAAMDSARPNAPTEVDETSATPEPAEL